MTRLQPRPRDHLDLVLASILEPEVPETVIRTAVMTPTPMIPTSALTPTGAHQHRKQQEHHKS